MYYDVVGTAINNSIALRSNYSFVISTFNQNIAICKYSYLTILLHDNSFILFVIVFMSIDFSIFVVAEESVLSETED